MTKKYQMGFIPKVALANLDLKAFLDFCGASKSAFRKSESASTFKSSAL
jgi:hypothetical protein